MGCDIHLHLEYHRAPTKRKRIKRAQICQVKRALPVIANNFAVPRDYKLFAALAGVRNREHAPVRFQARGLPIDVSTEIFHRFYSEVISDQTQEELYRSPKKWCTNKEAIKAVENEGVANCKIAGKVYVSLENYHNPSFLNFEETTQALNHAGYDLSELSTEFRLAMKSMETLDKSFGAGCSRIVFWFDS